MKSVNANVVRALPVGTKMETCDNSGAKVIQLMTVYRHKTVKKRKPTAGVGDLVMAAVIKGKPEMRKQTVLAVIVRQKKEYMRTSGERIKFADNAAIVLRDDKGAPKGTMFKGAIAKEVAERWPLVAKVAKIVV